MSFNTNITPGSPPLLWSDVHEAFTKVNENFDILVATVGGGSGLTPINFETLDTSVSPTTTNTYQLGSITNQWKSVYTGEFTTIDPLNGLWAGSAQIKGIGLTVNLPENSTIGGDPLTGIGTRLIIDPTRVFFKEVQIDNNDVIVAQENSNKFGINSGNGISMTVDSSAESVEINNTGILSVVNGSGITGSTISGVATVTNDGVVSFSNSTALPVAAAGRTAGAGIVVSAVKGIGINITNTGVLDIQAGSAALTVSKDTATGVITITNPSPAQNAFTQIEVNGDSGDRLLADSINDVLNLVGSTEIVLTKNSGTDTVTFSLNPVFDLKGSVFGDDSTKIVDAVENKVYAEFFGNLTGNVTGNVTGNADSATVSTTLDITNTNGLTTVFYPTFVENRTTGQTVRADVDLSYRTDTNTLTAPAFSGNLTGTVTGNIFTNLIDSADSSAITVTPAIIFSSDINIENDIQLSNIDASIRGTDKIKFVPSNANELSDNIRLEITSDNSFQPSLSIDTPSGVDLTLSSGLAGIGISKINSRVTLGAGNNTFIVKANGSWVMSLLSEEPLSLQIGVYIANGTTWDPASKGTGRPYPVWYDGVVFNALY
jgi:hypothetical protein